ncbi:hypothetical protein [Planctomyces sp. SH-PL14]|uniref:hypothetical protein n=1 Tax=Planctomyces sp. SH-PL14 TaxID=1632864 RepID=UPI0012E79E42|nr:hypothetical protein [Planctomyces sp. SH-PL14]
MKMLELKRATYYVQVNLKRLAENAGRDGEPLPLEQARMYLLAWKFVPLPDDLWQCTDHSLAYLRPDEIEAVIYF